MNEDGKQTKLFLVVIVSVLMCLKYTIPSIEAQTPTFNSTCITKTQYFAQDLTFSPDSKFLAASWDEENGTARIWNVETGEVVHTLSNSHQAYSLGRYAFSSDGKYLLTSSIFVVLWDLHTEEKVYEIEPDGEPYGEFAPKIVISPNDKYFLLTSDAGTRLYDFGTGKLLYRNIGITLQLATFSSNNRYILMEDNGEGFQGTLIVWDILANKTIHSFTSNMVYANFVDDGRYIATISPNDIKEYALWEAATYKEVLTADIGDNNYSLEILFSPDGRLFTTQGAIWDAVKAHQLYSLPAYVYAVQFTDDGRYLLVKDLGSQGLNKPIYRMWDIKLKEVKPNFHIESDIGPLGISPNGKYIAAGDGKALRLWNIPTGKELHLDC